MPEYEGYWEELPVWGNHQPGMSTKEFIKRTGLPAEHARRMLWNWLRRKEVRKLGLLWWRVSRY